MYQQLNNELSQLIEKSNLADQKVEHPNAVRSERENYEHDFANDSDSFDCLQDELEEVANNTFKVDASGPNGSSEATSSSHLPNSSDPNLPNIDPKLKILDNLELNVYYFYNSVLNHSKNFKIKLKIVSMFANFFNFSKCEINTCLINFWSDLSKSVGMNPKFGNDSAKSSHSTLEKISRDLSPEKPRKQPKKNYEISLLQIYALHHFFTHRNNLILISDKTLALIIDFLKLHCHILNIKINNETNFINSITGPILINFSKFLNARICQNLNFENFPIFYLENFSDQNFKESEIEELNFLGMIESLNFSFSPDLISPGQILCSEIFKICGPNLSVNGKFQLSNFQEQAKINIYNSLVLKSKNFWKNLTHLNLSHNQITFLDSSIFHLCPQLKYLDLSHNKIKEITSGCFDLKYQWQSNGLDSVDSNLQILDLSNNPKLFKISSMTSLSNLEKLNLSGCHLDNLSFLSKKLYNLKYLDLANNQFSEYEMITSLNLLPKLNNINLLNNNITVNHDYRVKILSFCGLINEGLDRKHQFILDGKLVSLNEINMAEVIFAMDEYEKQS